MEEITHLHPRLRRFLLPVYGRDQAIVVGLLITAISVGCLILDPPATPYLVGGALLGMWFVSGPHAPVSARVPPSLKHSIVEILDFEWRRSEIPDCWVPRVARWRRWGYVRICIEEQPGVLIVTGPETNVRPLLACAREAS
jgi:hypothetical protein